VGGDGGSGASGSRARGWGGVQQTMFGLPLAPAEKGKKGK